MAKSNGRGAGSPDSSRPLKQLAPTSRKHTRRSKQRKLTLCPSLSRSPDSWTRTTPTSRTTPGSAANSQQPKRLGTNGSTGTTRRPKSNYSKHSSKPRWMTSTKKSPGLSRRPRKLPTTTQAHRRGLLWNPSSRNSSWHVLLGLLFSASWTPKVSPSTSLTATRSTKSWSTTGRAFSPKNIATLRLSKKSTSGFKRGYSRNRAA